MEIGVRLKNIAHMVEKCETAADIGTDHGYLPIYLVKNKICKKVIATDINKGPVQKARFNIMLENLQDKIECRHGVGLRAIKPYEAETAIIAGMGGNLIRDIIEDGIDVFKSLRYLILQPAQNVEVLRKYIYMKGFTIIDEELCEERGIFYEIIKIKYDNIPVIKDPFFYEVSEILINKKHVLMNGYLEQKLHKYNRISDNITGDSEGAMKRKFDVEGKIKKLKELLV